jgi:hypothetical protein
MAGVIERLEVFGAGTHNASTGKVTITEDDLDQIVENFNSLQGTNIVKPHLKLGHQDAQKWFGQKTGVPTLGWISKVWREGKKLLANITDVPEPLLDLIRQGRYHNVSAEVFFPGVIEHNGKKLGHVLSAVALLGTEMPAVKDLAGLANALFAAQFESKVDAKPETFTHMETSMPGDDNDKALFTQAQVTALTKAAVTDAVAKALEAKAAEYSDLKAKLDVAEARAKQAETALRKFKDDAIVEKAKSLVDGAIKEGKLLPKQRELALAFMTNTNVVKFGEGEKSMADLFQEFLGTSGKVMDLGEKGGGNNGERKEFATAAEEVDHKTKLKINASGGKLTYLQAFNEVLAENAELKARYSASPLN